MNRTLHIVRKDLRHFGWALLVWVSSFLYLFLQPNARPAGTMGLRDFLLLSAMLLFTVFSAGLIAGIVQEDHPTDSNAPWRSRPISALRLAAVKLGSIVLLFVAFPLAAIMVKSFFSSAPTVQTLSEYSLTALVLTSVALSFTATSACTKNGLHSALLWAGVVFASGSLAEVLGRALPALSMRLSMQMNNSRVITLLVFSAVMSLAIILNQYLRRRLTASVVLLVVAAIGSALIGTLWSYYYFYQG